MEASVSVDTGKKREMGWFCSSSATAWLVFSAGLLRHVVSGRNVSRVCVLGGDGLAAGSWLRITITANWIFFNALAGPQCFMGNGFVCSGRTAGRTALGGA